MNLDCSICGKTSFTEIGGIPVCEDCFCSMQDNDYSDIKKNVIKHKVNRIDFDTIEQVVCDYYELKPPDLKLKTRKREIVQSRQLCHYLSKEYCPATLEDIGNRFGNKEHATVIYSCKTINNLKETNKAFLKEFNDIREKIEQSF